MPRKLPVGKTLTQDRSDENALPVWARAAFHILALLRRVKRAREASAKSFTLTYLCAPYHTASLVDLLFGVIASHRAGTPL